jgi:hypothetical protein
VTLNPFKAANLVNTLPVPQPQVEAWTTSQLEGVVWSDILGVPLEDMPVSRAAAMSVPAIARARHLTAGTIAKMPLEALKLADPVPDQPYWCQGSSGQRGDVTDAEMRDIGVMPQSTWWRHLWTVDDHLFYGASLWLITKRYAAADIVRAGKPAQMLRIPWAAWSLDDQGTFTGLDGQPILTDALVNRGVGLLYIPGPHEGILNFAQRTIRGAIDLERTAADVARRPFRLLLNQTTDITLDAVERRAIVGEARNALRDNDGVLFTNAAIEATAIPIDSGALLIDGRNASALDVARDVSMPAAMLDATTQGASLEYATLQGRNQQWIDYGLSLYMAGIAARLSMDDVVPQGQRVAFNDSDLTSPVASPTGHPTQD